MPKCPCSAPLDARGKCPTCDSSALRRPAIRGALSRTGRKADNSIGLNPDEVREKFYRSTGLTKPNARRWAKRR